MGWLVACDWSEVTAGWKNDNPALYLLQLTPTRYHRDICVRSAPTAANRTPL